MTKEEKIIKLESLRSRSNSLKKEVDYYNALQLALKLVLNGSYGAFATQYFILFNNRVAGTITAEGRTLTKTMSQVNEDYWYKQWHLDFDLHKKLYIKNVNKIGENEPVSIYGDTDSIFVGFEPCINSCDWKNNFFNENALKSIPKRFSYISSDEYEIDNPNFISSYIYNDDTKWEDVSDIFNDNDMIIISSEFIKSWELDVKLKDYKGKVFYNWENELNFIHGMDKFRIEQFFKDELDKHAKSYGVENVQDFELEKISDSMINLEKKKYIQHIIWEDGIYYEPLSYFQPKGVDLVRSSTPSFVRDKERGIPKIVKYLFTHPDTFSIKELLRMIKEMRREFELAEIDSISMQSSCSKYDDKVIDDKDNLTFVTGAHFAVKASAHHNHLLGKKPELSGKYERIKSGDKIKHYYCKSTIMDKFAYKRGEFPIEIAPEVDYDTHFMKSVLSPVNKIISKLGMPEISKRLSVVMDIFGGF